MASRNKETLGPANNYDRSENYFDTIGNAFNQLKNEINGQHGWNRPVEQMDGLTLQLLARPMIKISHAKYAVGSPYTMKMREKTEAADFLDILVSELKKKFKKMSGATLTLEVKDEQQDIQLYSKLTADRSWVFGGGSGAGGAIGRYLITTSRIYTVKAGNLIGS